MLGSGVDFTELLVLKDEFLAVSGWNGYWVRQLILGVRFVQICVIWSATFFL